MGLNQITAFGSAPPARSVQILNNAGQNQQLQFYGGDMMFSLRPTQWQLVPQGNWIVQSGQYSNIQVWSQSSYMWRFVSGFDLAATFVTSDGTNVRMVNTTGGVVGAVVTNAGSGYVAGFYGYDRFGNPVTIVNGATTPGNAYLTWTPSSGLSTYNTFVGGGVSSVGTPSTTGDANSYGGTGYTQAPNIIVMPPASQGAQPFIPATATCVVTAGQVGAITIINQGAGYVAPPRFVFVNATGDTTGAGAFVAANTTAITMTVSTVIQAITVASPGGNAVAADAGLTTYPTLTIGGTNGGASGTAATITNLSIRAIASISAAGTGYGNARPVLYSTTGGNYAGAAVTNTNPAIELSSATGISTGIMGPIVPAIISGSCAAGGTITATPTIVFGGYGYSSAPTLVAYPTGANVLSGCTLATFTLTMGGQTDTVKLFPI